MCLTEKKLNRQMLILVYRPISPLHIQFVWGKKCLAEESGSIVNMNGQNPNLFVLSRALSSQKIHSHDKITLNILLQNVTDYFKMSMITLEEIGGFL